MLQLSCVPERWWRKSLNQTDQAQFKFFPTNSRQPSMESPNNASITFLTNYPMSSVLSSNYITSCLSYTQLNEKIERIRKELAQTAPTTFTYLPTPMPINYAFPDEVSNSYQWPTPTLEHYVSPQDDISPAILPSLSCNYFVSLLGYFFHHTNLLYLPP